MEVQHGGDWSGAAEVELAHISKDQAAEEAKCWCQATCFLRDLLPDPDTPLFQSKAPVRG